MIYDPHDHLFSLEERVGIAAQQQQVVAGMESDEGYTDTIIEKFRAITRLAAPSWVIAMTQDNASSNINTDSNSVTTQYQQDAPIQKFKSLNKAMTDIVVHCVVLFKQSPVPGNLCICPLEIAAHANYISGAGLLYSLLSYFLFAVLWLNDQFQIVERVQQLTIECIKLGLKADEKYHLHEFASEAVYSIVSAFLKAIIAYKEAPLHKHDTAPKSGPRL